MSEIQIEAPVANGTRDAAQHAGLVGKTAFSLALTLVGATLLALVLSILRLNHGTFIYSMDDPYICLALSDQIRHGNYGINTGLHAAPDSSILYPFLIAPASGTPIHPYLPLIVNSLALFAALAIMGKLFEHLRLAADIFGIVAQAVFLLLLALCMNLIGVVFTGLEHNLHIAAVAATVYGLALFLDKGKMPCWLPVVIVLAPLLRYEGLALSLGALLVIALRGYWRTAVGAFAAIALCLGGFSAFLVGLGLPPMPSSILSKSTVVAEGVDGASSSFLQSIGHNVSLMAHIPSGILLLAIGVAATVRCLRELHSRPSRWSSRGLMALLLVCLIGAHAVAGQFGWLDRYEDYAMAGTALMGIYLAQESIRATLLKKRVRLPLALAAAIILVAICKRYIVETMQVPLAANNIYEQQFQMHRFVNDFYRGSVAVNDLGLVSYRNPNFVLDLGGLASEKARILSISDVNADAYRDLVGSSDVHLVIVYDDWFENQIPASWIKVASMDLSRKRVSSAESEVQFYATDASTAGKLQPELQSFSKTLPPGVKLTIYNPTVGTAQEAEKPTPQS